MSILKIKDLKESKDLDRSAMATIRGGVGSPFADVDVNTFVNIQQFMDLDINVLNGANILGSAIPDIGFDVNPGQNVDVAVGNPFGGVPAGPKD